MSEMKQLLQSAREEILSLRRANEILHAKVDMIDLFACLLHTKPATISVGASPDIAWALQKEIDAIEADSP